MLKLKLANGAIIEITDDESAITSRDELSSVFCGTSLVAEEYRVDGDIYDVSDMVFGADHDTLREYAEDSTAGYIRVVSAEWSFASTDFERFVQGEMNRNDGDDGVCWCYDVITHGCISGTVGSLIYTSDILKVLAEHSRDIQYKVDEITNNCGQDNMGFMFQNGFTFDKLVWMCFEETVRDALNRLSLEDV